MRRRALRRPGPNATRRVRDERRARLPPTTCAAAHRRREMRLRCAAAAARARRLAQRAARARAAARPCTRGALTANALPSGRRTKPPAAPELYQRQTPAGGFGAIAGSATTRAKVLRERRDRPVRAHDRDVDAVAARATRRGAVACAGPASWSSSANAAAGGDAIGGHRRQCQRDEAHARTRRAPLRARSAGGHVARDAAPAARPLLRVVQRPRNFLRRARARAATRPKNGHGMNARTKRRSESTRARLLEVCHTTVGPAAVRRA